MNSRAWRHAAITRTDAWAAGYQGNGPLVMHWNGKRWVTVTLPGEAGFHPTQVFAPSASDIQLTGPDTNGNSVIVHGNGSSWQPVPLPPSGAVYSIAVPGPADVWAVGAGGCTQTGSTPPQCSSTLYHWDGSTWSPYQIPDQITGIAGSAPGDVWAVAQNSPDFTRHTYTLAAYRWDGSSWSRVTAMPHPRCGDSPGIDAASAGNVWVACTPNTASGTTVAQHWNGHSWRTLTSPHTVAASSDPVWDGHSGVWLGPWAHWTGKHWVNTTPPPAFVGYNLSCTLAGLALIPGSTTLWGAGYVSHSASGAGVDALIGAYPAVP